MSITSSDSRAAEREARRLAEMEDAALDMLRLARTLVLRDLRRGRLPATPAIEAEVAAMRAELAGIAPTAPREVPPPPSSRPRLRAVR